MEVLKILSLLSLEESKLRQVVEIILKFDYGCIKEIYAAAETEGKPINEKSTEANFNNILTFQ